MRIIFLNFFLSVWIVSVPSFAADIIENRWGMRFIEIPAGEFQMGLQDYTAAIMEVPEPKENALKDELPRHKVKITKSFYMGETEVTQQQWLAIMENKPGAEKYWKQKNWRALPAMSINWFMAERFVEVINKMDQQFQYRLPTEAEWEYAARAGSDEDRPIAIEHLDDYAWFINNSGDEPQVIATRKPNVFGLYDMQGNVWEWVNDWYGSDTYTATVREDPVGAPKGLSKVMRGGSYHCPVHLIRPGYRAANPRHIGYEVMGFRLIAARI